MWRINNFPRTCKSALTAYTSFRWNNVAFTKCSSGFVNLLEANGFPSCLQLLRCTSRGNVTSKSNIYSNFPRCFKFRTQLSLVRIERRFMSGHSYSIKKKSNRTLYDVLEVDPMVTQSEIKAAYYELSMKYHPDVSSSEEAREKFTDITKAYSILSKIESRRDYDKEIGTYYIMRNQPKKTSGKVLRLMDDLIEINMQGIQQPSTFLHNMISLSSILNVPIRLNYVKNKTGVQSHDIRMLQLMRKLCNGTLVTNKGSSSVTFIPSDLQSGLFTMEAGRFGSISLLIESALPCLMFGPLPQYSKNNILSLKGTTHCNYGLHMDFINKIYRPLMSKFGLEFTMEIRKKSYIPHWDGKVMVRSLPTTHIKPVNLTDMGTLTNINCVCFVAGSKPIRIAQIMAKNVQSQLKKKFPHIPLIVDSTRERDSRSEGNGQGIIIVGETSSGNMIGGTSLWQKGIYDPLSKQKPLSVLKSLGMSSDEVVNKAVKMFVGHVESGNYVSEVLQDKVVLLMALASGRSSILTGPVSSRTKAAVNAIETLTDLKFDVTKVGDSTSVLISCEGLAVRNEYMEDDKYQ